MELSEFGLGIIYETQPKTQSEPMGFTPLSIDPENNRMVVLLLYSVDLKDLRERFKELPRIISSMLNNTLSMWDLLESPGNSEKKYQIPFTVAQEISEWDFYKGKFITEQEDIITSYTTVGSFKLPQQKVVDKSEEEEEYEVFHEALCELSEDLQAICQSLIQLDDQQKFLSIQWVKEVKHAIVKPIYGGVTVTLYDGTSYTISDNTLFSWGYKEKDTRYELRAAYDLGYNTAKEDLSAEISESLKELDNAVSSKFLDTDIRESLLSEAFDAYVWMTKKGKKSPKKPVTK